VIITAVTLGIVASLFLDAFAQGMVKSFIENSIETATSHIQIHHKDYLENEDIKDVIPNAKEVVDSIKSLPQVDHLSSRIIVNAMLASSRSSQNVRVLGVDPSEEFQVTNMAEKVREGYYFEKNTKNKILISTRLSEKLKLKLNSKLVMTFMDPEEEITAGLFRIGGLYDSGNNKYDDVHVFVHKKDLLSTMYPNNNQEVSIPEHEIAIVLKEKEDILQVMNILSSDYPELDIQAYNELSPELGLYESQMDFITWFYFIIIMFALIFGIVNTMLMAVLDRYKEFGVLMAVGLGKTKLFSLILLETIMLGLVAAPIGMLLGYLILSYFSYHGINLSMWSEFLEEYGMQSIVYTQVNALSFYKLTITLVTTTILAALYPAWKAVRLNPLEAIRKI
jgi:ABC-type lipoprotein release transport system permease subunit